MPRDVSTHPTPVLQRVLPVIDLASEQADSLGWQVREMNHLVLPHIKNAVLEAALTATQVRLTHCRVLTDIHVEQLALCRLPSPTFGRVFFMVDFMLLI